VQIVGSPLGHLFVYIPFPPILILHDLLAPYRQLGAMLGPTVGNALGAPMVRLLARLANSKKISIKVKLLTITQILCSY
jgi:hypothetical protein